MAGLESARHHLPPAEPDRGDQPEVEGQHHQRHRRGAGAGRGDIAVGQAIVGAAEAAQLVGAATERLDDADAGQILLHHGIEGVEAALHLTEQRVGAVDDPAEDQGDERQEDDEEEGEARAGQRGHQDAADEEERRADHHPQEHHHHLLHLGDVGGEAGDQLAGFEAVEVAEREGLHLPEEAPPEIGPEILRGANGEDGAAHPPEEADDGAGDHPGGGAVDQREVAAPEALVDDPLDQARLQEIHRHFEQHQQRREDRPGAVGEQKAGQLACRAHS